MKFIATAAVIASFATAAFSASVVSRQNCPEAARFGGVQISPSTLAPGDSFTITSTFNCSAEKGIRPQFLDYIIEVPSGNNGHEPNIVLARRDFPKVADGQVPVDTFTGNLPTYPGYFADANYVLFMVLTFPVDNGDGTSTLVQGSISTGLNITLSN